MRPNAITDVLPKERKQAVRIGRIPHRIPQALREGLRSQQKQNPVVFQSTPSRGDAPSLTPPPWDAALALLPPSLQSMDSTRRVANEVETPYHLESSHTPEQTNEHLQALSFFLATRYRYDALREMARIHNEISSRSSGGYDRQEMEAEIACYEAAAQTPQDNQFMQSMQFLTQLDLIAREMLGVTWDEASSGPETSRIPANADGVDPSLMKSALRAVASLLENSPSSRNRTVEGMLFLFLVDDRVKKGKNEVVLYVRPVVQILQKQHPDNERLGALRTLIDKYLEDRNPTQGASENHRVAIYTEPAAARSKGPFFQLTGRNSFTTSGDKRKTAPRSRGNV